MVPVYNFLVRVRCSGRQRCDLLGFGIGAWTSAGQNLRKPLFTTSWKAVQGQCAESNHCVHLHF